MATYEFLQTHDLLEYSKTIPLTNSSSSRSVESIDCDGLMNDARNLNDDLENRNAVMWQPGTFKHIPWQAFTVFATSIA